MFTPVSTPADSLSGARLYVVSVEPGLRASAVLETRNGEAVAVFDSGDSRPVRVVDGALWVQAPGSSDEWEIAATPGITMTKDRVLVFDEQRTPELDEFLTAGDYYAEVLDELDNGSRVEVYARL
ncbi:hypothetical protein [Corynebacterium halotolerans]|uniref:hypothetical protein n=1 Tax=Corynebacterium halotolerans TaxID=225326 RepID=UPI003CF1F873